MGPSPKPQYQDPRTQAPVGTAEMSRTQMQVLMRNLIESSWVNGAGLGQRGLDREAALPNSGSSLFAKNLVIIFLFELQSCNKLASGKPETVLSDWEMKLRKSLLFSLDVHSHPLVLSGLASQSSVSKNESDIIENHPFVFSRSCGIGWKD